MIELQNKTRKKKNNLFKSNPEMIEKLYNCDAEAINEIGSISQRGIAPDDVIAAYESGDLNTMNYLYLQAKRLVGLKELYKDLCFEYYKKAKYTSGHLEDTSGHKTNVKK